MQEVVRPRSDQERTEGLVEESDGWLVTASSRLGTGPGRKPRSSSLPLALSPHGASRGWAVHGNESHTQLPRGEEHTPMPVYAGVESIH